MLLILEHRNGRNANNRVFPKMDDSGIVGNKGLCREQNKFSKKVAAVAIETGTL